MSTICVITTSNAYCFRGEVVRLKFSLPVLLVLNPLPLLFPAIIGCPPSGNLSPSGSLAVSPSPFPEMLSKTVPICLVAHFAQQESISPALFPFPSIVFFFIATSCWLIILSCYCSRIPPASSLPSSRPVFRQGNEMSNQTEQQMPLIRRNNVSFVQISCPK